jgi:hypothetical protein
MALSKLVMLRAKRRLEGEGEGEVELRVWRR